jgi:hypothetical protein
MVKIRMTLEEAWVEFRETQPEGGIHVGSLEAMLLLRGDSGSPAESHHQTPSKPEQEEQGRFLDWLLHVKGNKVLAYKLLHKAGTITVGPRQYWASKQGERRAIAWESRYTYPGTDSEIWDLIFVD